MKKILIIPLLSVFVLFSCSSDKSLLFDNYTALETIVIVEELPVRVPGDFIVTDSCFVVIDPFGSDYALKVYSIATGEFLSDALKKGSGPNELATPSTIHYHDNIISVFDISAQKIVSYDLDGFNQNLIPREEVLLTSDIYAEKLYIFDDMKALIFSHDMPGLVSAIDLNNYENLMVVANPFSKYGNSEIAQQLNGTIKFDPAGNYFAFATYIMPYYSLQKIENISYTEMVSGFIKEPRYDTSSDNFRWIKEVTPNGFMDIALLPGRLFLLHAETTLQEAENRSIEAIPDIIYEIDFEGKLVTHYTLDRRVLRLASGKNGKLYGIAFDQQDDKFKIVELPV